MRQKIKDGRPKMFNLTEQEVNIIEQRTRVEGFKSESEFIGFLIRKYDVERSPLKEMEVLKGQRVKLQNQLRELDSKETEVLERMKSREEDKEHRDKQIEKAIQAIKMKIREGANMPEIEGEARQWAFRLNVDTKELIYKAVLELREEKAK